MEDEYVNISVDDEVKLARLGEIGSWFNKKRQMARTVHAMCTNLNTSERKSIHHPRGVAQHPIDALLWAMEQSDSPIAIVRRRWYRYCSNIKHPEDDEPERSFMVPFEKAAFIQEPVESFPTNHKRRKEFLVTTLPRRSPRFPGRSSRLAG
ncbi:hypothetical protein D1007_31653 [Hordeum vulgare]|nr:hypothetical protein D1007_31653 [Hordeum vulgare]